MKDIDVIASMNEDNIEIVEEVLNKVDTKEESVPERVNIICCVCKDRVGYIVTGDTDVPLRGDMIHRHPGCEHWPMPLPHQGAKDFACPHGVVDGGDNHLFVDLGTGLGDELDWLLDDSHKPFQIVKSSGECPCGCGGRVRGKNKYANGLICYRRHVDVLKAEIADDGRTT